MADGLQADGPQPDGLQADGLQLPDDPAAIRDEQVSRALDRLDDCGDLTAEQRAVVERLGDRLTARVLRLLHDDDPNYSPS